MLLWCVMSFHGRGMRSDSIIHGMVWDLGGEWEQCRMQLSNDMCEMRHLICFEHCKTGVRNQNTLC